MNKYYKENIETYLASPKKQQAREDMYQEFGIGDECLTTSTNDTFVPTDKYSPENLDKAEYNIQDRFGHLADE